MSAQVAGNTGLAALPLRVRGADARGLEGRGDVACVPLEALRRAGRRPRLRGVGGARLRVHRERAHAARQPDGLDLDRAHRGRAARARLLRVPLGLCARAREDDQAAWPALPGGLAARDGGARPLRAPRLRPWSGRARRHAAAPARDGRRDVLRGAGPARARRAVVAQLDAARARLDALRLRARRACGRSATRSAARASPSRCAGSRSGRSSRSAR